MMYQPPTDAATVDALDPGARTQYLGNALYPNIYQLVGEQLAAKITGMLLEMPTQNILDCMTAPATLKATVDDALGVLPEEERSTAKPPPASPVAVSPVSVLAGPSNNLWADEDGEDDALPTVGELFASVDKKRAAATLAKSCDDADAMETDSNDGSWQCEWEAATLATEPSDKLSEWMAARLDEQLRIPRAVIEVLGAPAALELLAAVERTQANGGMIVPETGKPRTSGGIFIKLLKDATHLPAAEHAATLERIKREGIDAKKAQQAKKTAARLVRSNTSPVKSPSAPTAAPGAQSPSGPPKAELASFVEAALRRQQSV